MRPARGVQPCILQVAEPSIGAYLAQVETAKPQRIRVEGQGRHVGKSCWLALVLETEYGYRRTQLVLKREMDGPSQDRASIAFLLEVDENDQTEEPQRPEQTRDRL